MYSVASWWRTRYNVPSPFRKIAKSNLSMSTPAPPTSTVVGLSFTLFHWSAIGVDPSSSLVSHSLPAHVSLACPLCWYYSAIARSIKALPLLHLLDLQDRSLMRCRVIIHCCAVVPRQGGEGFVISCDHAATTQTDRPHLQSALVCPSAGARDLPSIGSDATRRHRNFDPGPEQ